MWRKFMRNLRIARDYALALLFLAWLSLAKQLGRLARFAIWRLPLALIKAPFKLLRLVLKGLAWLIELLFLRAAFAAIAAIAIVVLLLGSLFWLSSYFDDKPSGVTTAECQKLAQARGIIEPPLGQVSYSFSQRQQTDVDATRLCHLRGLEGETPSVSKLLVDPVRGEPVSNHTTKLVKASDVTTEECQVILGGAVDGDTCRVPARPRLRSRQFGIGAERKDMLR